MSDFAGTDWHWYHRSHHAFPHIQGRPGPRDPPMMNSGNNREQSIMPWHLLGSFPAFPPGFPMLSYLDAVQHDNYDDDDDHVQHIQPSHTRTQSVHHHFGFPGQLHPAFPGIHVHHSYTHTHIQSPNRHHESPVSREDQIQASNSPAELWWHPLTFPPLDPPGRGANIHFTNLNDERDHLLRLAFPNSLVVAEDGSISVRLNEDRSIPERPSRFQSISSTRKPSRQRARPLLPDGSKPPRRPLRFLSQAPPEDFIEGVSDEESRCPVCYARVATDGFTECDHKVCEYCLEQIAVTFHEREPAAALIDEDSDEARDDEPRCPMCRQGRPAVEFELTEYVF
ncbi:hypothetical protein DFH27DRAFT_651692 [Peziza echinospora]|nr:hypothetical protein DFH27DRAFT_651692 [Peziza echinospora]